MADVFKGLVDRYGRPIEKAALKVEQASQTVAGIRRNGAMHPAAGLTPGRLANILRSSIDSDPEQYLALAEDMEERDLHYAGVLGVRKRQVSGLEISVVAAGEDKVSVAAADLVREIIARDGFEDELFDILDAVGKGFSCTEILWDTSEGQWRPKRLAWRDPRWFTFDQADGETPLLKAGGSNVPLNSYQWIYHSAKVKSGLPIRGGLARAAAWSFLFKSYTVKDWAIFCEAYGQPLRLGKYDAGASDVDKDILLKAVGNIGVDYAAIIPQSMAIDIVGATLSGNHEHYEKRADWLDRQVSKVVLGQTATTDAIAGGHAVGKTHDKVREDIEAADARQEAATLNRDLVRPAVDLNFGPQQKYPKLLIGRPDEVDVEKFMGNVKTFVSMGGKVGAAFVADKIGVPEPGKDEELLVAPKAEAPVDPVANPPPPQPLKPGETRQTTHSASPEKRDAIEREADAMLADWLPLVSPIVAGLETELAAASSVDDVKALLANRFAGLDATALTELLAKSAFAARLAGETDDQL
ncbi:DUF935 domain-containing protein [Mesorhizobium sp.]|uniref:DUF935 domain-containing protein n=1 Tax=Mesorhizobium sp. TaxID=1871066 RepID=UPI000FE99FD9|nr:DUF935 domain-containing protein [Mesorhizobium sp.]RWC58910.1 MAG: DUF935 domain-containing protein [Mesorhizobium sp.]RWC66522.1 MAG: DUF935 domain-containing protein [Mesorhizobium sp.]